jgi:hypothetical protein
MRRIALQDVIVDDFDVACSEQVRVRVKRPLHALQAGIVVDDVYANLVKNDPQDALTPLRVQASTTLPGDTLEDWVSYSDEVAVVSIGKETSILSDAWKERQRAGLVGKGEGLVARRVSVRIDRTLWKNTAGGKDAPRNFDTFVAGWILRDDKPYEYTWAPGPRIEPGHKYNMAIAELASGEWSPISPYAVLAYDDERIGSGEEKGGPSETRVNQRHKGQSAGALAEELADTPPDETAKKYSFARPLERSRRVAEEKHRADQGAPKVPTGAPTGAAPTPVPAEPADSP